MEHVYVPPGWPPAVPPPGAPDFNRRVKNWLLDLCPPDYRGYPLLGRHPVVLARFTARLLAAQRHGTDEAVAGLRADLAGHVPPQVLEDSLRVLRAEQHRLDEALLALSLVESVLRGQVFVARMPGC